MAYIAIMGYGTVGSGVYETLNTNEAGIDVRSGEEVRIKYVLDLRDFPGEPVQKYIVHDFETILNDDDVKVVVEVMGGIEPAFTFVKKCLLKGKSVVTSNKELVAMHGAKLLAIAKENNVNFLFEASVGGGIPIIRPLNQSLTAEDIYEITGILNGTTNFILTKMKKDGTSFEDALKAAQEKGYAERKPDNDVLGYDACRKIAILSSLAYGRQVDFEDIHTEGITEITFADIEYADKINGVIKLIAKSVKENGSISARVSPVIITEESPLANVDGVFNAILVKGNIIGEVMFYGMGAGKLPTASAVVSDVIDCVKHFGTNIMHFWSEEKIKLMNNEELCSSFLVRFAGNASVTKLEEIGKRFKDFELIEIEGRKEDFAIIARNVREADMKASREFLGDILNAIRIE